MNTETNNLKQKKPNPMPLNIEEGKAFAIANWSESFENAQTRRTKHLNSVLMPIRGQSNIQKRILRFQNGYKALAIWHLIIQMAAECPQRGLLVRGSGALDFEDISLELSIPEEDICEAFSILCHEKVQLIEIVACPQNLLVSGSLRKGRKKSTFPQALKVKTDPSGPAFHIEEKLRAYVEFSESKTTFTTKPMYLEDINSLLHMSEIEAAKAKLQSVLEHNAKMTDKHGCSELERARRANVAAKANLQRLVEGS